MKRVVGDIGGTNARFAWVDDLGVLSGERTMSVSAFPTFEDSLDEFLDDNTVDAACFAFACPVHDETFGLTNSGWIVSKNAVKDRYNLARLDVINDFVSLAKAVPFLAMEEKVVIGGGEPVPDRPIGVIGPGTGLGVSGLVPNEKGWSVVSGEGGHVDFAPVDDIEIEIYRRLQQRFQRVSAERLLSGSGLENIFQALVDIYGADRAPLKASEITSLALKEGDELCIKTLTTFCAVLGSTAGNLALTLGAIGGIYIGGGIPLKLGTFFHESPFRERFEAKGRMSKIMRNIPTYLIDSQYPALRGAAYQLLGY